MCLLSVAHYWGSFGLSLFWLRELNFPMSPLVPPSLCREWHLYLQDAVSSEVPVPRNRSQTASWGHEPQALLASLTPQAFLPLQINVMSIQSLFKATDIEQPWNSSTAGSPLWAGSARVWSVAPAKCSSRASPERPRWNQPAVTLQSSSLKTLWWEPG